MKQKKDAQHGTLALMVRNSSAGSKLLESEKHQRKQITASIAHFFEMKAEDLA